MINQQALTQINEKGRLQGGILSQDEAEDENLKDQKQYRGFINQQRLQAAFVDIDAMNNSGGSGDGRLGSDFNNEADDE